MRDKTIYGIQPRAEFRLGRREFVHLVMARAAQPVPRVPRSADQFLVPNKFAEAQELRMS